MLSRTVSGLNEYLEVRFEEPDDDAGDFRHGTGHFAHADPGGKGIYFVNGKASGLLTVYNVHSKQSTDIASQNATQPVVSRDGKR